MKSLAVCVLLLAVVGLATCASRSRRQAPPPPEGAIPEDAATFIPPESPLNTVVRGMITKTMADADLTGAVDRKALKKIETLSFVIQITGDTVSEDNQQGIADLQEMVAAEDAAAVAEATAEAASANPAVSA